MSSVQLAGQVRSVTLGDRTVDERTVNVEAVLHDGSVVTVPCHELDSPRVGQPVTVTVEWES